MIDSSCEKPVKYKRPEPKILKEVFYIATESYVGNFDDFISTIKQPFDEKLARYYFT